MNTTPTTDNQRPRLANTSWRLDPQTSAAEFRVPSLWGLATVRGRFERLAGSLEVDEHGEYQMELLIEARSLHTGNGRRDAHLRSADFFDCDRHPEVRFRSTSVDDRDDGRLGVTGELQAGGRRLVLQLQPTVEQRDGQLELHAETTIDQRQLGMTLSRFGIKAPATVIVDARLGQLPSAER